MINFTTPYKKLSDKELVDLILQNGNEEAMLFIIFNKYDPLLKTLCRRYYDTLFHYEELQTELFIHFKADDWYVLRAFGWRSSFGTWFGKVAGNLFLKKMPELIDIGKNSIYIGEDGENAGYNPPAPEPVDEQCMVMLIEAIQRLEDKDQRFILLREFEGYEPCEIAMLLEKLRRKEGRLKTRKVNGQIQEIIPTAEYVHMLKGRAKTNLRVIVNELKKDFEWK